MTEPQNPPTDPATDPAIARRNPRRPSRRHHAGEGIEDGPVALPEARPPAWEINIERGPIGYPATGRSRPHAGEVGRAEVGDGEPVPGSGDRGQHVLRGVAPG